MHQFGIIYVLFWLTIFIFLIIYFFIYDLQMQRKVILCIHIIWSNIPSYILHIVHYFILFYVELLSFILSSDCSE